MSSLTSQAKYVERAQCMLDIFKKHGGDCEAPMELSDDVNYPAPLKALLLVCKEWHTLPSKEHYEVFGVNLFQDGHFLDKVQILSGGDEEYMNEWRTNEDHDTPNCAQDGWECFGALSEFDFLFVNIDPNSEHYGSTRRVVNNNFQDFPMTDTFHEFFGRLEGFSREWHGQDIDERDVLFNFRRSSRYRRPPVRYGKSIQK